MVSKAGAKKGETVNRAAILDAAENLLREHGYRKMTIEDIADLACLGKGTVYLYFPSKEEVALSVIDRKQLQHRAKLELIAQGSHPVTERLFRILCARVMIRFDAVQGFSDCIDELLRCIRRELLIRREINHRQEAQILAGLISEGVLEGALCACDPMKTALAMVDATNSFMPYSLNCRELGDRVSVLDRVEYVSQLLVASIRT